MCTHRSVKELPQYKCVPVGRYLVIASIHCCTQAPGVFIDWWRSLSVLCPSLWSAVERKVDYLVKELERHSISIAAVVVSLGIWHLTVTVGISFL